MRKINPTEKSKGIIPCEKYGFVYFIGSTCGMNYGYPPSWPTNYVIVNCSSMSIATWDEIHAAENRLRENLPESLFELVKR